MQQFILKYRELLLVLVSWFFLGLFFKTGAIAATFIFYFLFIYYKKDVYVLFSLFFVLILSDNYSMSFAAQVKPLLILLLAVYVVLQKKVTSQGSLIKPFLFFFIVSVFSLIRSPILFTAIMKNLSYFLLYLSLPPLLIHLVKKKGKMIVLDFISLGILVILIGFFYLAFKPSFVLSHGGRFKGLFGNPNGLGIFSFLLFSLYIIAKKHLGIRVNKWQNILYQAIIFTALFYSKSRGAIASVFIFTASQFISKVSIVLPIILVPLLGVYLDSILNIALFLLEQFGLGKALRVDGKESLEKASGRAVAWFFAWKEIQKNFYFGRGWAYDEYWIYGPIQHKLNMLNHQGGVHNSYLIFWLNTGFIGLFSFVGGIVATISRVYRKSELIIPLVLASAFSANFEPWLAASLNPFTIMFLMGLTLLIYFKPILDEETSI